MWDPFREIRDLNKRVDLLTRELWRDTGTQKLLGTGAMEALPAAAGGWKIPTVDVKETDKEITVIAEMPGINKEDIDIDIHEDRVEIRAETKEEKKEEKEGYIYKERREGSFYRSLALPASVNAAKAKATYKDGVLTLALPKSKETKKTKIKIE